MGAEQSCCGVEESPDVILGGRFLKSSPCEKMAQIGRQVRELIWVHGLIRLWSGMSHENHEILRLADRDSSWLMTIHFCYCTKNQQKHNQLMSSHRRTLYFSWPQLFSDSINMDWSTIWIWPCWWINKISGEKTVVDTVDGNHLGCLKL